MKTITLCSSVSFYEFLIEIEKEIKKIGFNVEVPVSARKMEQSGDFSMKDQKIWMQDPAQFSKKTALMDAHFRKVKQGDAVLVINQDKNGVKGYIGGNVLMEMTLAYFLKKPIFVWRSIKKEHPFYEEVMGMKAVFLNEDVGNLLTFFGTN